MTASARDAVSCYWLADRERRQAAPPLSSDTTCDVAIVGGGYTGMSTAYHLKTADPGLDVAILEAETAGYGASGRNAGFVMTLFGASVSLMKTLHGKERVRAAHAFMMECIATLETMIERHGLDCDYERSGFLKVATAPAYLSRIQEEVAFFQSLGIEGFEWLDRDAVQARVRSPGFLGASFEPACGLINPMKWLDALRRLASDSGVRLFEGTPVREVRRESGRYRLITPNGIVTAEKVVYATNGYTHLLPGLRSKQLPAFAYVVVTEPLTPDQQAAIGWAGREGIEDGLNFMHFYRLTRDGRILAGGGPGLVPFAGNMDNDASPKAWSHLERFIGDTFPPLRGIGIAHRWGGAFSVTSDSTPQVGTLDEGGVAYAIGCTGHGVAQAHMNGRILRDLVLAQKTDLTDLWFVNRRSFPIPPEPIRWIAARTVTAAMALDDWWCNRATRHR